MGEGRQVRREEERSAMSLHMCAFMYPRIREYQHVRIAIGGEGASRWQRGGRGRMGERVNGLPRPCEPPDHTGRAATTRPLQHPSSSSDSPSNRQTARPLNYLTDRIHLRLLRADSPRVLRLFSGTPFVTR